MSSSSVFLGFSPQLQLSTTLWSKCRMGQRVVSLHAWSATRHCGWGGLSWVPLRSFSIHLHLSTKTAPSGGWRSLYLSQFHPRMTHKSQDSLILISLLSFCTRLSLFDFSCLAELERGSCSCSNPTGWDKSKETILAVPQTCKHMEKKNKKQKNIPSKETQKNAPTESNKLKCQHTHRGFENVKRI